MSNYPGNHLCIGFKFQSDSINTCSFCDLISILSVFKFQSDSINTARSKWQHVRWRALNSNLILLIRQSHRQNGCLLLSLNSNLILLILHFRQLFCIFLQIFKFQSDSINTLHAVLLPVVAVVFKFQSDSINTAMKSDPQLYARPFKFQSDSINTVIVSPKNSALKSFKFQSDSINTSISLSMLWSLFFFKFQSDSINTVSSTWIRRLCLTSLNSNLILLIQCGRSMTRHPYHFKFQSDSINTPYRHPCSNSFTCL